MFILKATRLICNEAMTIVNSNNGSIQILTDPQNAQVSLRVTWVLGKEKKVLCDAEKVCVSAGILDRKQKDEMAENVHQICLCFSRMLFVVGCILKFVSNCVEIGLVDLQNVYLSPRYIEYFIHCDVRHTEEFRLSLNFKPTVVMIVVMSCISNRKL